MIVKIYRNSDDFAFEQDAQETARFGEHYKYNGFIDTGDMPAQIVEDEDGVVTLRLSGDEEGYTASDVVMNVLAARYGFYYHEWKPEEPRGWFEVFKIINGVSYTCTIEAANADDAMAKYCKALGIHHTDISLRPGGVAPVKKDRPTVAEVFALIDEIKHAVKDPKAGIRQKARNFRYALNNWLECGSFGTGLYTGLKDSEGEGIFEGDDVEADECGKMRHVQNSISRRTYYKALPGRSSLLCLIPPEAMRGYSTLLAETKERGIAE